MHRSKDNPSINLTHLIDSLRRSRPASKSQLKNYIKFFLDLDIPSRSICPDHQSPLDYLWYAFNIDFQSPRPASADLIVWANRAGGKTLCAAIATLLDCIFKPSCKIRILAGSIEQGSRLYNYLLDFIQKGFEHLLLNPPTSQKCAFKNLANVELLAQSPASIRGQHIQKLRADEIDLFNPSILEAAKFTTISNDNITAAMEFISTMHRPYGTMQSIISTAQKNNHPPIFKWCIWETIERCTDRSCSRCPLNSDCMGRAKLAQGYLKIDDIITHMKRSSRTSFEAEMLCLKPSLENIVFPEFDPQIHVKPVRYNPNLPLYRSLDFGFINPFVCLWIQTDNDQNIYIIDEYLQRHTTIEAHAQNIKKRTPGPVSATFCDPAGNIPSDQTGLTTIRQLHRLGIPTRSRRSSILEGLELIRRALKDATGQAHLFIAPHCHHLIEALHCYHYPDRPDPSELPLKDGRYDHPIDTLRYFFINHHYHQNQKTTTRFY